MPIMMSIIKNMRLKAKQCRHYVLNTTNPSNRRFKPEFGTLTLEFYAELSNFGDSVLSLGRNAHAFRSEKHGRPAPAGSRRFEVEDFGSVLAGWGPAGCDPGIIPFHPIVFEAEGWK